MKVYTYLLSLLIVSSAAVAGAIIKDGTLQAHSDGNNVTIQWGTEEEVSIREFDVYRQAGSDGGFVLIGTVMPKGSDSYYEFVDQSAFKTITSVYQYRITILFHDGNHMDSKIVTVSHNVSGVKRTWGSLKAMFR